MPSATEAALARIAELRRLEQAATQGDWETYGGQSTWLLRAVGSGWNRIVGCDIDTGTHGITTPGDAAFIPAARNALPAMLDALEALIRYYGADADDSTGLAPQIDAALARLAEARCGS